jgi:hypothetical protein
MKENVGNNGPKNLSADPKLARKNIISKLWRKVKMEIYILWSPTQKLSFFIGYEYKASIHKTGKLLHPHDQRKFSTFQSTKDKKKMTGLFKILSQNDNGGCFKARKASMEQTVALNRNYLERDNIYIVYIKLII